jgi:hypothetical protein
MAGERTRAHGRPEGLAEAALAALDEAFDRKAWHGPNLRGSLRGLDERAAAWRPGPGRHNVWELVVHAAYWKYAVRRLLTGEKRGAFALPGSNWFARPAPGRAGASRAAWAADVRLLDGEHRQLRAVVAALPPGAWTTRPSGSAHTVARLVFGAAMHDTYHAGQVRLLKRLAGAPRARARAR